jgi:hypothetical protein
MSEQNVEIVRALVAGWNAGYRDMTRLSNYLDPRSSLNPLSRLSSVAPTVYFSRPTAARASDRSG